MGDLTLKSPIEIYSQEDLALVDGRFIYNIVGKHIYFDDLPRKETDMPMVAVRIPSIQKMLELKRVLEYKWFMPIHYKWKTQQLVFKGHSAHMLLKLIEGEHMFQNKKRKLFEHTLGLTAGYDIPIYAAGAIEKAPDKGVGYRRDLKEATKFTKLKVVDPCDFAYNLFQGKQKTLTEVDQVNTMRDSYVKTRSVVEGDCAAVVETEATVALIDQYLGAGTTSELTVAVAFKRPIYAIVGKDYEIQNTHPWIRACPSRYFSSIEDFAKFVKDSETP